MKVLVTGGAGYVGGCVCDALEDRGHAPVVVDDLRAGGAAPAGGRAFHAADMADGTALRRVFEAHPDIVCTVHCAALTAAPASSRRPYEYYAVNVGGSLALFDALRAVGRGRVVFSSSASVYGATAGRVAETAPLRPASPYGRTKQMAETILEDFCRAYGFRAIAFRYFNVVGADPRMRRGPRARPPTDAVGRLVETALGRRAVFRVTGADWPTRDGTAPARLRGRPRYRRGARRRGRAALRRGAAAGPPRLHGGQPGRGARRHRPRAGGVVRTGAGPSRRQGGCAPALRRHRGRVRGYRPRPRPARLGADAPARTEPGRRPSRGAAAEPLPPPRRAPAPRSPAAERAPRCILVPPAGSRRVHPGASCYCGTHSQADRA